MTDESQIAKNIKHMRIQRGLTIKQLAEITGFSQGYISRIENSEKAPPVSTLIILSKAFGIDTSLFFSTLQAGLYNLCAAQKWASLLMYIMRSPDLQPQI